MNDTVKPEAENRCPSCHRALSSKALEGLCPACLLREAEHMDTEASEASVGKPGRFQPPSLEELGRLFPKLEVMRLLGAGGMGAVYLARQMDLGRLVALKVLPADADGGTRFSERFNREARALARLNHPNIVAVYEFGSAGSLLYFLMEFVDGANLRQLQRAGRLSPREALQIVPQICDALQYAHDEGVVHRDIKPENVLLDRKGRVKIADFGLAKLAGGMTSGARLTLEGQVMGTPHYMAPEQVERPTEVDHRADIFALGVVFYELLTGDLPLGKFAPPSSKVEIDVRLDDIVLRALENDQDRRYQHASEVKQQVENVESDAPESSKATPAGEESLAASKSPQRSLRWMGIPVVRERDGEREVQFNAALGALILCMAVVASAHLLLRFLTQGEPAGAAWMVPMGVWVMIWGIRRAMNQPGEQELRDNPGSGLATLRSGRKHGRAGDVLMLVLLWFGCVGVHVAGVAMMKTRVATALDSGSMPAAAPIAKAANAAPSYAHWIVDPSKVWIESAATPEFRFLAWQSEWDTQGPNAARTPAGNRIVDPVDLQTLKQVQPGRLDLTAVTPGRTNPPLVHVWISHPAFDRNSLVSLELLDAQGQRLAFGSEGSMTSGMCEQLVQGGRVFWLRSTFNPRAHESGLARGGLRVHYAVGEPENVREITPKNPGGMTLENGTVLGGVGQKAEGQAFLSLTTDSNRSGRQFVVRVLTKSGELLDSSGSSVTGFDAGKFLVRQYEFSVPLDRVAEFRVGSRRVRTHVWDNVQWLPVLTNRTAKGEAEAAREFPPARIQDSKPRPTTSVAAMETPELRFLAWQSEWDTQGPKAARTYVGNRQVDLVDIETLKRIRPGRLVQTNFSPVHVWISHPSFDGNSLVSVEPLDKRGEWVDSNLEGDAYSGMGVQLTQRGSVFWLLSTFELSTDNGASARRGLRVRYAVGELENIRGIEPMKAYKVPLDNGASVLDIGQSVLGHAFVSLTGDFDRSQRQFVARVLTTSGELLDSSELQRTGFHDGGKFRVQRFEFGVPLDRVAEFRVGSRPVLTHVWDKVELPLIPPPPLDTNGKVSLPPEREFLPERFEDLKPRPTARVEADGSGDYKTLQEALDALPPHSWIQLGSGRFSETLRILKPVWISGQGESTVLTSREPWRDPTPAELGEYRDRRQAATSPEARQAMEAEFVARFHRPVLEVSLGDRAVAKLRHLRVTLRGIPPDGALSPVAAVSVASGSLELVGCGVVGSAGNGIIVARDAEVKLSDCLIAAAWNVGIAAGPQSKAKVWNSVIRNCYYSGITAGAEAALEVRDSWISGSAWHGIRYDNASPSIHNCWIEGNARSGVYASGTTRAQLFGNWFVGNGMSGVSCWMDNRDAIMRNTFLAQPREALALVGSAAPTVEGNIFLTNHIALLQSRIQGKPGSEPRPPKLRRNLFHGNHTNAVWAANSAGEYPTIEIGSKGAEETESLFMDPGLTDPRANRLEPVHGLSAHTHQVGAPSAALQRGRFELQPEEIAMIPEGNDRDSKRWKRRQP